MSKGIIVHAFNNEEIDYVKQAIDVAKRAKKHLDLPTSVITDMDIDNSVFDKTVTIKIADRQDIIFTQFEEEIYARGIGLIQRQFKDIETQPGKYKDGIEYTETLLQTNW